MIDRIVPALASRAKGPGSPFRIAGECHASAAMPGARRRASPEPVRHERAVLIAPASSDAAARTNASISATASPVRHP